MGRAHDHRAGGGLQSDTDHDVVHWLTPVTPEEYAAAPTVD
ncbi:hypothetical protein ACFYZB_27775 [Streptomyces sp. NPDC001852]